MITEEYLDFAPVTGIKVGGSLIGKPLMKVIFYFVDGVLIDTGSYYTRRAVEKFVRNNPVNKILLTHYHEDHAGNAGYLSEVFNLPVYGHALTARILKKNVYLKPYEYFMFGPLQAAEIQNVPAVVETDRFTLHPIHTPGHSVDHLIYHERNEGWVFTGDLFLGAKIKYFRRDENVIQLLNSLKLLASIEFDKLFCGHNPKLKNPKMFVEMKIRQVQSILEEVEVFIGQGVEDKEIRKRLVKNTGDFIPWLISLGDVSYKNLIQACIDSVRERASN